MFCWPNSILTKCHIQGHFLSLNVTFKQKHIHHGFDGHFGTFNYNVILVWPLFLPQSPSSFYGSLIFFVPFHSISYDLHPSSSNKLCEAKMLNIEDRKPQILIIHDSIWYTQYFWQAMAISTIPIKSLGNFILLKRNIFNLKTERFIKLTVY